MTFVKMLLFIQWTVRKLKIKVCEIVHCIKTTLTIIVYTSFLQCEMFLLDPFWRLEARKGLVSEEAVNSLLRTGLEGSSGFHPE